MLVFFSFLFFLYLCFFLKNFNRYEFEVIPKIENWKEKCLVYDLEESLMYGCLKFAKEMESEKQEASFCK